MRMSKLCPFVVVVVVNCPFNCILQHIIFLLHVCSTDASLCMYGLEIPSFYYYKLKCFWRGMWTSIRFKNRPTGPLY